MSLTGIAWASVTLMSFAILLRLLWDIRQHPNNVLTRRFAEFFIPFVVASAFIGSPIITSSSSSLGVALFFGHFFLWLSFLVLGDILWFLRWRPHVPRFLIATVMFAGGALQLFLEFLSDKEPQVIPWGRYFTVTQWNTDGASFIIFLGIVLLVSGAFGLTFLQRASKFSGPLRIRGYVLAYGFAFSGFFAALSALPQPVIFLVVETFIVVAAFLLAFFAVVIMPLLRNTSSGGGFYPNADLHQQP